MTKNKFQLEMADTSLSVLSRDARLLSRAARFAAPRQKRAHIIFKEGLKKDGTVRPLISPRGSYRAFLDDLKLVFQSLPRSPHDVSYRKGGSNIKHAWFHAGDRARLVVDLAQAFPLTRTRMIERVLRAHGVSLNHARLYARAVTVDGTLPQGFPTSPYLFGRVMLEADLAIGSLCRSSGLKYTRYADDLAISGNTFDPLAIISGLQECLGRAGYRIKSEKTEFGLSGSEVLITGLLVGSSVSLRPEQKRRLAENPVSGPLREYDACVRRKGMPKPRRRKSGAV